MNSTTSRQIAGAIQTGDETGRTELQRAQNVREVGCIGPNIHPLNAP